MRKSLAALALAAAALFSTASPAMADAGDYLPEGQNSNAHVPAACDFQSSWSKEGCTLDGVTYNWTVSIQKECLDYILPNMPYFDWPLNCWQYVPWSRLQTIPRKDWPKWLQQRWPVTQPIDLGMEHQPKYKHRYYTVRRGDTLWHIAVVFYHDGHKYHQLMKLNHLHSTRIYPGEKLRIS